MLSSFFILEGRQLPTPCQTRWNSYFDSLNVLLSINVLKFRTFCEKMQVSPIDLDERNFLKEYVAVMEPIATYLDLLQGEVNCFLGLVLPSITMLNKLLNAVAVEITKDLRDGLLKKIGERYFYKFSNCFPKIFTIQYF